VQNTFTTIHKTHTDVATAGTAKTQYLAHGQTSGKWKPQSARFVPNTTAAADASHYATIALKDSAAVTLGSITSASTALTAGTSRALTLSLTAEADIGATGVITCAITKTGNGAVVDGEMVVEWERLPGDTF
jgi:hypothetical protein